MVAGASRVTESGADDRSGIGRWMKSARLDGYIVDKVAWASMPLPRIACAFLAPVISASTLVDCFIPNLESRNKAAQWRSGGTARLGMFGPPVRVIPRRLKSSTSMFDWR